MDQPLEWRLCGMGERQQLAVLCRRRRPHRPVRAVGEVCCYDETPRRAVDVIRNLCPAHPVSVFTCEFRALQFQFEIAISYTTFFVFNMRLKLPLRQRTTVIGIRRFTRAQGRSPALLKGPIRGSNTQKDYVYRTTFAALSPRESVVTTGKVPRRLRLSGRQTCKSMIWASL